MIGKAIVHPESGDLVAFGLGKLDSEKASLIETHLADCQTCCETMLDLKDDTLTHPNIVTAFDAEQAGDQHFLVMEFVDGTDLASVIKQRGPLPVSEACDCIRQAALGLQHAHEKGMVHRDIKPHNLMLSPNGQVRILDFGLAGFAAESAIIEAKSDEVESGACMVPMHLTSIGSVMGTPDFIAPEQAKDAHSADIRADIYSLGCTLHYLLDVQPDAGFLRRRKWRGVGAGYGTLLLRTRIDDKR